MRRLHAPDLSSHRVPLVVLATVVVGNYLAQVPYALHLYGFRVNPWGVVLLAATWVWFAAGWLLAWRGRPLGFWVLLSFLMVEFVFYFRNEILLIPQGFGVLDHLFHARDPILWAVFFVGDVNFVVAGCFAVWLAVLWWRRPSFR